MPRDGAVVLADLRNPTLSIVCEPCGRRGTYNVVRLLEQHGDAKLTDLLHARQLSEGALGQHPRSVQGGVRRAGRIVQADEEALGRGATPNRTAHATMAWSRRSTIPPR
jgi:hypothetical protein